MKTMRLGDICRVQNGFAFNGAGFSTDEGMPLIRIRDLKTNRPSLRYIGSFSSEYVVNPGDLLVGMDGEFRAYRWRGEPALLNQRVCRLITDPDALDQDYLYFVIGNHLREIERKTSLTTVKHLSARQILSIVLPVPSVADQRALAVDLGAQLRLVSAVAETSSVRTSMAQHLRSKAYENAFASKVPLALAPDEAPTPQWSWRVLTDLARQETGHTPSRNRPEWWTGDIPWIALPDIRRLDGRVAFDTIETTNPEGIANSSARILPAGTVVMSRTASVGFVTRMGRPMATSQDFVNWVCGPELDPEFLMHLLIRSRDEIRALSSGAIHKTVYMPTLKALQVCVPGIDEQRRIAAELRDQLAAIDAMEASMRAQQEAIDALPAALLRRAFEGLAA